LRRLRTARPPSKDRVRRTNFVQRRARRRRPLPRSRQVRRKFRGMWSSRNRPFGKRLVHRYHLRDRNAAPAALGKGAIKAAIKAAEAEVDAGGKGVEVKVTVIKDATCRPRNTPRRAPTRRRVGSLVRNCRLITNQSFCRASLWPNTRTAYLTPARRARQEPRRFRQRSQRRCRLQSKLESIRRLKA